MKSLTPSRLELRVRRTAKSAVSKRKTALVQHFSLSERRPISRQLPPEEECILTEDFDQSYSSLSPSHLRHMGGKNMTSRISELEKRRYRGIKPVKGDRSCDYAFSQSN